MKYTRQESATEVVIAPAAPATRSVIWLHGLGADGNDFVPIVPELRLPDSLPVRFIFPHAPVRPVTVNNGFMMRAWYDIKVFGPRSEEDDAGIRESERSMQGLIEREIKAGIAARHIVLAGFSQGGAIALHTGLRYPQRLAGIMALSTYLPLRATLAAEAAATNRDVPIFMAHGAEDPVVPMSMADTSLQLLKQLQYEVDFHSYPMPHSVCAEEVADIAGWLQHVLA